MSLTGNRRIKDGTEHRFWSIAEKRRRVGGRVVEGHSRKPNVLAGDAGKEWRCQRYREHYKIERKHAEQKNRYGLRRARPISVTSSRLRKNQG